MNSQRTRLVAGRIDIYFILFVTMADLRTGIVLLNGANFPTWKLPHSAVLQLYVALGVCEQIVTIRDNLPFPAMTSNTCFGSHSGEVKKYSLR